MNFRTQPAREADPRRDAYRMTGPLPSGHPRVKPRKIGVLLMNLGTPDATDYWSMRRYLHEFLSDRRVIEKPRWFWWPLLNLIILQTRPQKKGKDYDTIWNKERDEGPLKTFTRGQAERLAASVSEGLFGPRGKTEIIVDWAMRYGNPSVKDRLAALQAEGCDRILAVPLYPQYAAATSATACDKLFEALMQMRWQPTLRVAPPYHDEPAYIDGLARSLKRQLAALDFEPDAILCSFHGVPQEYLDKGDPYHCHCAKTTRLLRDVMGWPKERFFHSFQSRFGPDPWIKPYTDEVIKELPSKGVKKLAVITPGFSADCLETIEEIGEENRHYFEEAGGEKFAFIESLNDSDEGMAVIEDVVRRELMGWI